MRCFDKLKIRQQMIAVLSIAIITILLINMIVSGLISRIVMEKSIEYADNTADKFVQEIEYTNEKALSIINFLQYSDIIQEYFQRERVSNEFQLYSNMDMFLTSIRLIYPELEDIALIGRHQGRSVIKDQDLQAILERHPDPGKLECDGILEQTTMDLPPFKMLIYIRNFYGNDLEANYAQPIGRCVLGIRFTAEMDKEAKGDTSFLVMDQNLHYYAINCSDETAERVLEWIDPAEPAAEIDNSDILLKVRPVEGTQLYVASYTDKRFLFKDVRYVQLLSAALFCVVIGILAVSVLVISRNVVSPIYRVRQYMSGIAAGNYTRIKQKVAVSGNLEMVELAGDLNALIAEFEERTHRLFATTNRMYEMELEKRQAEVSFLRSQINPHFLYNSLETLKGICMKNHLPQGAEVANNLGKIFRYSIKGEDVVRFREELEVARAYVEIQTARFPHKVKVLYGISSRTLDIPVIKMILQPVVENVFQHAVEKSVEKTTLYIASRLCEGDLVITVQDDGAGIPPDLLEELKRSLAEEQVIRTGSIGLVNVNLRIRLLYGPDYGLRVESRAGEGTKVTLRMATRLPGWEQARGDNEMEEDDEEGFAD